MSEIFNLSFGQFANNTSTHLYNCQESEIPYTKSSAPPNHDLNTFLYKSLSSSSFTGGSGDDNDNGSAGGAGGGSSSYYPRALVFDLRGGLGALGKYEYSEQIPSSLDMPIFNKKSSLIPSQLPSASSASSSSSSSFPSSLSSPAPRVEKNEYQRNLDQGKPTSGLLNTRNTRYWSDYNKLIYNPKSIITIPNYQHVHNQPGSHYNFNNQKFATYDVGHAEFNNALLEDEIMESFRSWLERCDYLQGIQLGTSMSDAWGGFTTAMVESIQDEYFNNKMNIWTFALLSQNSNKKISTIQKISEIKSFVELSKLLNLFFPIKPDYASTMLQNVEMESVWHTSSIQAIFINSIWGINNQFVNQVNMLRLQDSLLRGDETRKIVNEIKIVSEADNASNTNQMMDVNLSNIQDWTAKLLNLKSMQQKHEKIDLGLTGDCERYFSRNIITKQEVDIKQEDVDITNMYQNLYIENILTGGDTFPTEILKDGANTKFHVEFNVHQGLRSFLKPYRVIIENIRNSSSSNNGGDKITQIVEDKDELLEDLTNTLTAYSSGYESDDDDFYD